MKTKLTSIILAALMLLTALTLGSCGKKEGYVVGICQFAPHEALDAATKGFKDALVAALGDKVTFDEQNAAGEPAVAVTQINSFVSKKYDLILANATPVLQAAYNATNTIPILGTSVTEYGSALQIENFNGTCGNNVSGTSDLAPLDQQAAMIKEWFPEAKKAGLLYCSAEANSDYQVKAVSRYLRDLGIEPVLYSFSDSNDIAAVTTKACSEVDVLYIPTDNTAANCVETIGNIVKTAGKPVIAGEAGICKGCGIATLSIDYYALGYKTGEMAAKILKGEADVTKMPIEYVTATKLYSVERCTELGLTVPEGYSPLN